MRLSNAVNDHQCLPLDASVNCFKVDLKNIKSADHPGHLPVVIPVVLESNKTSNRDMK